MGAFFVCSFIILFSLFGLGAVWLKDKYKGSKKFKIAILIAVAIAMEIALLAIKNLTFSLTMILISLAIAGLITFILLNVLIMINRKIKLFKNEKDKVINTIFTILTAILAVFFSVLLLKA